MSGQGRSITGQKTDKEFCKTVSISRSQPKSQDDAIFSMSEDDGVPQREETLSLQDKLTARLDNNRYKYNQIITGSQGLRPLKLLN
jgi:hypothetical protein